MSKNTIHRIISALVLAGLLIGSIIKGQAFFMLFMIIAGVLAIDEICVNFFQKKRFGFSYLVSQASFLVPVLYFAITPEKNIKLMFVNAGVLWSGIQIFYLFNGDKGNSLLNVLVKKVPFLSTLFILLPVMSLSYLVSFLKWRELIGVLFLINFGMDTAAWFFGKNFGKHKMSPSISPNKTIEGLVGGFISSGIIGGVFWYFFIGKVSVFLVLFFMFLGFVSQMGDLVQSKMKRFYGIKDSSSLIPGHGGVYDRIDSLLFLAPFFAVALNYLYF